MIDYDKATTMPIQGGMSNPDLFAEWSRKLPGVTPTNEQISAFAIGIEVGFAHAQDLERQDWARVHHVLKKHGKHPGRTDDHVADIIDAALCTGEHLSSKYQPQIVSSCCGSAVHVYDNKTDGWGAEVTLAAPSESEQTDSALLDGGAVEKDAARYRFLREDPPVTLAVRRFPEETERGCYLDGPNLDDAIDQAIAASQSDKP